jgi:hypothetical protein
MQPMSIRGPSTSVETPINRISDYAFRTDLVASHSRNVGVPIGPVDSCRKSFRYRLKVCFIWVSAVSEYLSNTETYDPHSKFRSLLPDRNLSSLPAEQKMDNLYADILNNSDWDDKSYVEIYYLVVGSIVALKTPLSASAI